VKRPPPSASACKTSTEVLDSLPYPFTLEARQQLDGKENILGVGLDPNDPTLVNTFQLSKESTAIFKLDEGKMTGNNGTFCSIVNGNILFEDSKLIQPWCGNKAAITVLMDKKNPTWGIREMCLPGNSKPPPVLLPLFDGKIPEEPRKFHG